MPDTDYLAERAAKLWLAWNPVRTEFVPSVVADAVTEWAEAVAAHETGTNNEDICGLCGGRGADKMAIWTGGGVYWPGERLPDGDMVHQECEQAETKRAHSVLTQEQRNAVIRSISGGRWP